MPKVLIVDDESSIRITPAEFLRREGFETFVAADAAQAVALFDSHADLDAAVVDINLPGRGGIGLLRELTGREPHLPVIMITGEPNVSHLRNRLADKAGEEELRLAERIVETVNHLSNTVNQITSFARPLSLEFREADLNGVVRGVLQLLEPQLAAGKAEKRLRLHEGQLRARADESSLRSALTNLTINAVQAMPGGGRLTVATRREAESLVVEIEDTGVGMSEEQSHNVFEAFYTTKSQGLGLGMPYAKKVVEEHGGRVSVESRAGEGTTVSVRLPGAPGEG